MTEKEKKRKKKERRDIKSNDTTMRDERDKERNKERKRSFSWNSRTKLRPSYLKSCSAFKRLGSSNLAFLSSFDWIICGLGIKKFGFVRFWAVLSY